MTKEANVEVLNNVDSIYDQLNKTFTKMQNDYKKSPYPTYAQRKETLLKLKKVLIDNEQDIYEALKKDYGYRSEFDSLISDVLPSVQLINYVLKHLKGWMKPSKRHSGLMLATSKVHVHYQPLGVVGVITPWNFPIYLSLGPAIQALAAGNRVMIKMSENTPNISALMRSLLSELSDHICIVPSVKNSGSAFSKLPFNHLIFTGSSTTGKKVAQAAGANLTPITLELGGKSPTIVGEDANMKSAVDAIIVGKSTNSGQICVAPDYVFVPESREAEFTQTFLERYREYHIESSNENTQTHIVNHKQLDRLHRFLEDAEQKGGKIQAVKAYNKTSDKLIYPHVVTQVKDDMDLMNEEIFGSVLPVLTYRNIDEVIQYVNARPRPLALYIMSTDKNLINKILKNTHSGGVSINDTAMHVMADDAPFGGVGNSGMGHYHGHEGFLTFSKAKTVLHTNAWIPKNRFILKNRDLVFKVLRSVLLK